MQHLVVLRQPDALNQQLLQTVVLDSIAVAAALKLQYLWVNKLCIVQDDDANKLAQIGQMTAIYGLAWLTIVALSGTSSNTPLPVCPRGDRSSSRKSTSTP